MSTKQERQAALSAARILGIKGLSLENSLKELHSAINAKLGNPDSGDDDLDKEITDSHAATIVEHGVEAIASATGPVVASVRDIPNLAPSGQWEGKRAHLKRTKTGHNDMSGAIFNWNGYPCIIPIDIWVDIPWPILNIIKNCRGMDMDIRQEDDPRDKSKVRNVKEETFFDKYPFQFEGVTPGTEHLPESPWEYTLNMYVEDFPGYTVRMWRQLCILWEISDVEAKISAGISPKAEIETRRNAIHFKLSLPLAQSEDDKEGVPVELRQKIRNEKRLDIGMGAI